MNLNVYSIYDKAVGAYARPFFMQSDGQAVRGFSDLVKDQESEISRHPEDYALFRLATFDDGTGVFRPEEPSCLARGHEVVGSERSGE